MKATLTHMVKHVEAEMREQTIGDEVRNIDRDPLESSSMEIDPSPFTLPKAQKKVPEVERQPIMDIMVRNQRLLTTPVRVKNKPKSKSKLEGCRDITSFFKKKDEKGRSTDKENATLPQSRTRKGSPRLIVNNFS